MESVGVKELRDNLSSILKKVEDGEVVRVMRHGKDVVEMQPLIQRKEKKLIDILQKKGVLGGGTGVIGKIKTIKNTKPDKPISDFIIEDRR